MLHASTPPGLQQRQGHGRQARCGARMSIVRPTYGAGWAASTSVLSHSMSSSAAHKRIIFAGMGCTVGLIGLLVFGVVLALRERPDLLSEIATMNEYATPAMATAALDSLDHVDWSFLGRARSDHLSLPPTGTENGAAIAVSVWSRRKLRFGTVPYGDTAAVGTQRWNVWRTYTEPGWVDSLIEAAHLPWRLSGDAIVLPD